MTTTYKRLASYFLSRARTSGSFGYYYGNDEDPELLPFDFNSIKRDNENFVANFNAAPNTAIAEQPDGKILVGGASGSWDFVNFAAKSFIVRLNLNGSTDNTFDVTTNSGVSAIAIQPNGDIILGGTFTTVNGITRNRIARVNSLGVVDTTFNPNITVIADGALVVDSIIVEPDGKILVGGSFGNVGGTAKNNIVRLFSDGRLDTSFVGTSNGRIYAMARQGDGKIVVGGQFSTFNTVSRNRLARINPDGSLDTSLNAELFDPFFSVVQDIKILEDEDILVAGKFTLAGSHTTSDLLKIKNNGKVDTTFSISLTNSGAGSRQLNRIGVQQDGKIVLAGSFGSINGVQELTGAARINKDGSLDKNFKTNILGSSSLSAFLTFVKSDGRIFFSFFNVIETSDHFVLFKEVVDNAPYRLAYTVPGNTQAIIKNIFVTNHNDFPVFHDIAILPESDEGEGISEKHYYVWDNLIDENEYEIIDGSITLSAGDEVYVYSSTDEDISYNIFGVEITE
jgi:uncharacterized delta-60 repeat protein